MTNSLFVQLIVKPYLFLNLARFFPRARNGNALKKASGDFARKKSIARHFALNGNPPLDQ
jgi:hypothetical protein